MRLLLCIGWVICLFGACEFLPEPDKDERLKWEEKQAFLRLVENPNNPEESGYVDKEGKIVIPFGKYPMHFTDTFRTMAIVIKDNKITAINRKEETLFEVFNYDNGPDYISEGLFRIIKNGKIGFANEDGTIIIPPKYDCQWPFKEGVATFCENGRLEKMGEYDLWVDAKWGAINKKGEIVIPAVFDAQFEFSEGKASVKQGNEEFEINLKGERIED